jgi:hypothetical protein
LRPRRTFFLARFIQLFAIVDNLDKSFVDGTLVTLLNLILAQSQSNYDVRFNVWFQGRLKTQQKLDLVTVEVRTYYRNLSRTIEGIHVRLAKLSVSPRPLSTGGSDDVTKRAAAN